MVIRRTTAILPILLLGLLLAACGQGTTHAEPEEAVHVEQDEGSELARITLSANAMVRLAVATTTIEEMTVEGERHKVIPHAAIMWDSDGQAWTYTVLEPRVFMRAPVNVLRIGEDDTAVLGDGPDVGTEVVTVGASELWGAEHGVGGGH